MVKATKSEANKEKAMAKARPRVSFPVIPWAKIMGKNTAMVVRVEAVIAIPTSDAPLLAASFFSFPSSMCR